MSKEEGKHGEHGETVEHLKLMNDKLLNTPPRVDELMRQAMTDDGKKDKLGDEVHLVNNPKVSRNLSNYYGSDDDSQDNEKGRERKKEGGGIFGFLGFGGRKRRRRKKSRKKKKSKKRKSRRRRKRGGVGDKSHLTEGWCPPGERKIAGKCVPIAPITCKEDEELKSNKITGEPYCEKKPTKGGRRRSRRRKKRRKSKKRRSRRRSRRRRR